MSATFTVKYSVGGSRDHSFKISADEFIGIDDESIENYICDIAYEDMLTGMSADVVNIDAAVAWAKAQKAATP